MLVLDFKVDYRLKTVKGIPQKCMDCLTRMHRRKEEKYDTFCTHPGRDARITSYMGQITQH